MKASVCFCLTNGWLIFLLAGWCLGYGNNSELTEYSSCPWYMFSCGRASTTKVSSQLCIYPWMVCDGIIHCPNKADEVPRIIVSCESHRSKFNWKSPAARDSCLPPQSFPCGLDNTCIPSSSLCDGVKDCKDGQDELEKSCKLRTEIMKFFALPPVQNSFTCLQSKETISLKKYCDGNEDCKDATDEGIVCQSGGCNRIKDVCPPNRCYDTLSRPICECGENEYFNPFIGFCQEASPCLFGPCEHICRPKNATSYTCQCRDGYNLVDEHKCIVKGEVTVVAQKKSGVMVIIKDVLDGGSTTLRSWSNSSISGITIRGVDLENDTICYTKGTQFSQMICSKLSKLSETWSHYWTHSSRTLAHSYDWVSKNWYFLKMYSIMYGHMTVSSYDFKASKSSFLSQKFQKILIDPIEKCIFFVSSKDIVQMSLSLEGPKKTFFKSDGIKLTHLSIEHKSIYIVETKGTTLKRITYPEGRITTVLDETWIKDISAMSVLGNHLYYILSLKGTSSLRRVRMSHPKVSVLLSNSTHLNRFLLLHPILQPQILDEKPCKSSCANLCLRHHDVESNSTICRCSSNSTQDAHLCSTNATTTSQDQSENAPCPNPESSFKCTNGACINKKWLCDGWDDCGDNSDETDPLCTNVTCADESMVKCSDNTCISKRWLCDGEPDCPLGEDEDPGRCPKLDKVCGEGYVYCASDNQCIPNLWLCDGELDCSDGSDEEKCTTSTSTNFCKPTEFKCHQMSICISSLLVCDGSSDCLDNSDEMLCNSTSPVDEERDENGTCDPALKFLCAKTKKCIPSLKVCDGLADCGSHDYSDEHNCTNPFLCKDHPSYFQCHNGFCISQFHKCDGFNDCGDFSDETSCENTTKTCSRDQFGCQKGKCIPLHWRCDGTDDCSDNSDEMECDPLLHCKHPNMPCDSKCLPLQNICDGKVDCSNGTDEGGQCEKALCNTAANCSHFCGNTPSGYVCTCPLHLILDSDNSTCIKEPICKTWGICSQKCEESGSLHKCTCLEGYVLQPDKFSCLPNDTRKMTIVFSNRHELRQLNPHSHTYTTLIRGQRNVIALNFFYNHTEEGHNSLLFWNDVVEDKIYRGTLGSTVLNDVEPIVKRGLMTTEGLAVDWVTEHIYWVESTLDQIEVSDFSGNQRLTVVSQDLTNPRGIALDPNHGYLFWTDWDQSYPRIERSNMDGEDRKVLFDVSTIAKSGWPNGLTADFEMERLYWVDARSDSIHTIDYNGRDEREIIRGHNSLSHPFAISTFGNNIYWSDWRTNSIYSANKWNGSDVDVVERTGTQPFDIRVFHPKVQKAIPNPCKSNTCGIGSVCLLSANQKTSCKCPLLTEMEMDSGDCKSLEKVLLILRPSELRGVYVNDVSKNAMATIVMQDYKPSDVDYDAQADKVFIGNMENLTAGILTSDMINSDLRVIDVANHRVPSLAYDWISHLMYFSMSQSTGGQIAVSRSDGTFRAKLDIPVELIQDPISLTIHPTLGFLFWIDAVSMRVIRSRTDGGKAIPIFPSDENESISKNMTHLYGLTLNMADNRLWWVIKYSTATYVIVYCSVAKEDECRPTVFEPKKEFKHISALTVDEDTLYFTQLGFDNTLEAVNVNGSNFRVLRKNIANILSLKMFNRNRIVKESKCSNDNGGCGHLCIPNIPEDSLTCLCAIGYLIDPSDRASCQGQSDFLLFSKGLEISGVQRKQNGSADAMEVFPSISGVKYVVSLDFVHDEDLIVYMDNLAREITSIRRDLTRRKVIMSVGITGSEYITVDWLAKNLYWTDAVHDYICASRLDGSYKIILIHDIQKPYDIAVDPINGYLYWSEVLKERNTHSSLMRSRLDGSNIMTIFEVDQKRHPARFLTFDAHSNRLYWFETTSGALYFYDTLTPPDKGISEFMLVPSCLGIAVFGSHIYWALQNGTIMRALTNKSYPLDAEVYLHKLPSTITDITWFTKQKGSANNPCNVNNGGCQQLCLFNGSHPVCKCSHGKVINVTKCEEHEVFLAYSKVSSIETMSLEKTPFEDGFDPNPVYPSISDKKSMVNVIGLAYDQENKRYFYSDIHLEKISSAKYNGSDVETIIENVGSVEGLTYNHLVEELYWTSYTLFSIFKISLKKPHDVPRRGLRIVQLVAGDHPRSITHEPCFNTLYWTNWNLNKPSIMSSNTDGSSLRYIITSDIKTPNSIALDQIRRKLFWSDAKLDKIEECNMDGSDRKVILSGYPQHSFGLAVHKDFLYWTDWLLKAVVRLDINKGMTKIVKNFKYIQPMGVVVVSDEKVDCSINPCYHNKGGCSDTCNTNAQSRRICSCKEGSYLAADGVSCLEARSCGELFFQCHNSGSCISYELECNGKNDCSDGSDEMFCASCPQGKFKCWGSDTCIDISMRCDAIKDCEDASDEMSCPPNKGCIAPHVACNYTTACIKSSNLCDGMDDCWDMEDERNCSKLQCLEGFVACKNQQKCIPMETWCNGEVDCINGSDEQDCTSKICPEGHFQCDSVCLDNLFKCDGFSNCRDGKDEEGCSSLEGTCSNPDFRKCPGSDNCIPFALFCNGISDCPNGTDENSSFCTFQMCKPEEFMCSDKDCIPRSFVCDGEDDCLGGSDELPQFCELKEECRPDEFKCASEKKCIPLEKKCNGKINCKDHSDEDTAICSSSPLCVERMEFMCNTSIGRKKARKDDKSKNLSEKEERMDHDYEDTGVVVKCINMEAFCHNASIFCGDGQDEHRRSMCGVKSCMSAENQCEQICEQHTIGHKCRCMTGYQLNDDHITCSDIDECERYVCTQHCTNLVGSHKCFCSENYTLASDGSSCRANSDVEAKLLMSNRYYIRSVPLDGSVVDVLVPDLQNAVALDFDWKEQMLYWSDVTRSGSNITRMKIDGTMKSIVHTSPLRSLDGIAVDWIGRNLYWCDKSKDTIEVTKLDGRYRKVLVRTDLHEPRAIVLHPFKGLMFYSDWGDNPHIGRSGMDGSQRIIIVQSDILGWPNALAVDLIADRLWWVDAKLDYIAVSALDGSNMRYIIRDQLPHVFSLAMFEDYIYWADWDYKSIERAHKLTGAKRENLTYTMDRPMAIQIFHPFTKPEQISNNYSNPCLNEGNCPLGSLCLLRPGGEERFCMCPEGHYISEDGSKCIGNCTSSEFLCATTYKCIPFWWRCDGQNDCGDYSDEPKSSCPTYHCKFPGMFQCKNATSSQQCFIATRICDGEKNCEDGSDEVDCDKYTCMESQFKCEDRCIQQMSRCNGVPDCKNGEDERDCPESTCVKNHFHCKNSRCVPLVWKCDGENDCGDNTDEPPDCATQTCPSGYLKCVGTGKCVPETWKCDGDFDCGENDHTDESPEICQNVTCPGSYFKCKNNRCIPGRWRCDYDDDCKDGSDEEDCAPRVCMDSEFQCLNIQQCIPNFQRCDGMVQCNDGTDESKCDEVLECDEDSFKCNTSGLCIPKHWVCDRAHDCLDGSDELNCFKNFTVPCNSYEKACLDGQCIPLAWWCDGMDDCVDESDEEANYCAVAPCSPGYFQCASKTCVLREFLCDGLSHCPDGSDEFDCPPKICASDEFQCLNHMCIDIEKTCNGENDCSDGSDEDIILCNGFNTDCSLAGKCSSPFNCSKTRAFGPGLGRKNEQTELLSQRCICLKPFANYNFLTNKCERTGEYCSHPDLCPRCSEDFCGCGEGMEPIKNWQNPTCSVSGHARVILNADGLVFSLDEIFHGRAVRRFPKENLYPSADLIVQALKINSMEFGNITRIFGKQDFMVDLFFYSQSDSALHKMSIHINESSKFDDPSRDENPVKIAQLENADDIAVDWIAGHIYWIDASSNRIMMSDLDGSNIITINNTNLHVPLAIAVNPHDKVLCWTIVGFHARIECSNLDGTERRFLVDEKVIWPTDLAFDSRFGRIFWADMKKQTVESIRLDGQGRRTVWTFQKTNSTHLNLPFRMDILGDFLYILLHRPCKVMAIYKFGKHREFQPREFFCHSEIDDLVLIHQTKRRRFNSSSACFYKECPENSVCFDLPTGPKCVCIDGFVQVGNGTCVFESQTGDLCQGYCLHGGTCIFTELSQPKCNCKPGFNGARCDLDACYGFCVDGHITEPCRVDEKGRQLCSCKAEYDGPRCEHHKCDQVCLNSGVCYYNPVLDTTSCQCRPGYEGHRCELKSNNSCQGFLCHNNGKCFLDERHRAMCECPDLYAGKHCENCKPPGVSDLVICGPCYHSCANGDLSSCQVSRCHHFPQTSCHFSSLETLDMKCTCPPGFQSLCPEVITKVMEVDSRIRRFSSPTDYNYNSNFREEYSDFYKNSENYDEDDDDDIEDETAKPFQTQSPCLNCVDTCFLHKCLNNGSCGHKPTTFEPFCKCQGPFRGERCHVRCSCFEPGTKGCFTGKDEKEECECKNGYAGEECNVCNEDYCGPMGTCHVAQGGAISCKCNIGYTGNTCDIRVGCSAIACHNNGTCQQNSHNQSYYCKCPEGAYGELCQQSLSVSFTNYTPTILTTLAVVFLIAVIILVSIFIYKKSRNQFRHKRMVENGMNMEISNPIYVDEDDDDDRQLVTLCNDSSVNFTSPSYSHRHEVPSTSPNTSSSHNILVDVGISETVQLLDPSKDHPLH